MASFVREVLLTAAVLAACASPAHAAEPTPPPEAAQDGYTKVSFNAAHRGEVSCSNEPQVLPWKQGLWWEDGATLPACKNTVREVYDPVFGMRVLDLRWTLENRDQQNETSISTFPRDYVSPHFSFLYGYLQLVARWFPASAGIWPVLYTWTDFTQSSAVTTEIDVVEYNGGGSKYQAQSALFLGNLHFFYPGPQLNETAYKESPLTTFDPTQPHTYGVLRKPGYVCSYLDHLQMGDCQGVPAGTEAPAFLVLGMGVGCGWQPLDESCLGTKRADLLVNQVTVWERE